MSILIEERLNRIVMSYLFGRSTRARVVRVTCVLCATVVASAALLAIAVAEPRNRLRPGGTSSKNKPTRNIQFNFFNTVIDGITKPFSKSDDEDIDESRPPAEITPVEVDINDDGDPAETTSDADSSKPNRARIRVPRTEDGTPVVNLWIEWGAGNERRWRGRITVDDGELIDVRPYGFAIDSPASVYLASGSAVINQRSPSGYNSLKLSVKAPLTSKIWIELAPTEQSVNKKSLRLQIKSLLTDIHRSELDAQGNLLIVRRAPGDDLRVEFERDTLVFAPKETFKFDVRPHLIPVESDAPYRCRIDLLEARTGQRVNTFEQQIQSTSSGQLPLLKPISVKMPTNEGAYDIAVYFSSKQITSPLSKTTWDHQRRVQVVVVDGDRDPNKSLVAKSGGSRPASWNEVIAIQPASLLDRTKPSGSLNAQRMFSGKKVAVPLLGGKARSRRLLEQTVVELAPQAWQAIPLKVRELGQPHVVEVGFPGDIDQRLGMRILELGADGRFDGPGLDTGLATRKNATDASVDFKSHRMTFWPRTKQPVLLLTNRSQKSAAMYGTIRVLAGPEHLPEAPIQSQPNERLFAAYFDRPAFADNSGASDALDEASGRVLKDWHSYYRRGQRLVEYLRHVGYNGAMICVARDGGAIYPSARLGPTPRFDDGVFFSTGQDVLQKDVLEMLLRMFDRAGLKLVPSLKFSAPLPELEKQIRAGGTTGIQLVNFNGENWIETRGASNGAAPYYNPLDPRVQKAIQNVVEELTQRYGDHDSFGGVALQFGMETYVQLPDQDWGADDMTLARFSADEQKSGRDPFGEGVTEAELRTRWMQWRARQLANWYQTVGELVVAAKPAANLYLSEINPMQFVEPGDTRVVNIEHKLNVHDSLLRMGIDPKQVSKVNNVVLLRTSWVKHADRNSLNLDLATEAQRDEIFAASQDTQGPSTANHGSVVLMPSDTLELKSLYEGDDSKASVSSVRLSTQYSFVGLDQRRQFVHDLATSDSQVLLAGGRMAMFGQEKTLKELIAAFRRLPAKPFQTVGPDHRIGQPIVTRTLSHNGETYIYLVNDSPWPTTAVYSLTGGSYKVRSLGNWEVPETRAAQGTRKWSVRLRPYDFVAASFSTPNVQVLQWQAIVDREAVQELVHSIDDVEGRLQRRHGPPRQVLKNPGFDVAGGNQALVGWQAATGAGITVRLERDASRGDNHALYLRSIPPTNWTNGPIVWVRSDKFPPPPSGRIAVLAWMRTRDAAQQPRVRMVIEGGSDGGRFVRHREFGATNTSQRAIPLREAWSPHLFAVSDLPRTGLNDLRIGFDLRGTGEVWIDQIEVYDIWLNNHEFETISQRIEIARQNLKRGQLNDCKDLLNSYWAQSLRLTIPTGQTRSETVAVTKPNAAKPPASTTRPKVEKQAPKSTSTRPPKLEQPPSLRPDPSAVTPPAPAVSKSPRPEKPSTKPPLRVADRPAPSRPTQIFRLPPVLDEDEQMDSTVTARQKDPIADPTVEPIDDGAPEKPKSWLDSIGGAVKKVFAPPKPKPKADQPKRVRKSLFGGSAGDPSK